jgi:hydroxymethylbilane synthase
MKLLRTLTIGSRKSPLALWQTHYIIERLQTAWPDLSCTVQLMTTQGDQTQAQNKPLPAIGGKGLFTLELEEALRNGEIDLAVHSLKDLPVEDAPGLTVGAITNRADVRDALVARNGWTLATLPTGAIVGTSSTRRQAQLLAVRPDLTIRTIRGNVETRLRKVESGEYDATLLAAAGLDRLGLAHHVTEWLPLEVMLPAPGQGALAVQCRAADEAVLELLAAIEDARVRAAVTAERCFLRRLGGGCAAPVAAYAQPVVGSAHRLAMTARVATIDGSRVIHVAGEGDAAVLADQLAAAALAQGAAALLHRPPAPDPATGKPLAGKRIAITRPADQASELVAALAELGAEPLLIPTIQIEPLADLHRLDEAIAQVQQYDWLVFTSANAVTIFNERWQAAGQPVSALATVAIAAVGPATGAAVQRLGVAPTFVPDAHVAEALAAGLGEVNGRHILLPQAAAARPLLAEQLSAAGAQVEAIPVYNTIPAPLPAAALTALAHGVDAVLFTSGSTVRNLLAAVADHPAAQRQIDQAAIICIGPVTAQLAQEAGLAVAAVAGEATTAGLVQTLLAHFSSRGKAQ